MAEAIASTEEPVEVAESSQEPAVAPAEPAAPARPESVQETMKRAQAEAPATEPSPTRPAADQAKAEKAVQQAIDKALEAPGRLPQALKAEWDKLPRQWQQELVKLNSQQGQIVNEYGKAAKSYREMAEAYEPYKAMFHPQATPQQIFRETLEVARALRSGEPVQRLEALGKLIQDMGLTELVTGLGNGSVQLRPQPMRDTDALREIAAIRTELQARQQAEHEWIETQADQSLDTWLSSANPVHYERVAEVMANLLQGGQASDYQEAYDKACRLDPEVYPQVLQAEVDARIAAATKKAEAARRAAISPRADGFAPPALASRGRPESVEESMRRAQEALGG